MPAVLVPFVVVLLAMLPGLAASRWCVARTGQPLLGGRLSPFPEILLGLALWSWSGLLLAELGLFSIGRVAALLLLCALGATLAARGRAASSIAWPATIAGAVIAVLVALFYSPAYETIAMASDATVYLATGVHIARHGSIAVPDLVLPELGLAERSALLPIGATSGWVRMAGGVLVSSGTTEVMWPTYFHLLPVWVASFTALGGIEAAPLVPPVFAALAVWAVFLFAREAGSTATAAVASALLLTNVGEMFYGRFLMPEIVTQLFLWGGLLAAVRWWRDESPGGPMLSALGLGTVALARVEYLVFAPVALALRLGLAARRPRGVARFAAISGALFFHGAAHLVLVPSHYRDVLVDQLAILRGWLAESRLWQTLGLPGMVASLRPGRRRTIAVLAVGCAALVAAVLASREHSVTSAAWLVGAVPWPILLAAAIGLVLWTGRCLDGEAALVLPLVLFAVVTLPLLYDPHVTRSPLWGIRRFLPMTIPFLYVVAAIALPWRRATWLAAVLAVGMVVLNALPTVRLHRLPIFPAQKESLAGLAARVPAGAVVFIAPDLADYALEVPLWLVHGRDTFTLPPWDWRGALRATAPTLARRHPLYLVAEPDVPPAVPGLTFTPIADTRLEFATPTGEGDAMPTQATKWPVALRLYEIKPVPG